MYEPIALAMPSDFTATHNRDTFQSTIASSTTASGPSGNPSGAVEYVASGMQADWYRSTIGMVAHPPADFNRSAGYISTLEGQYTSERAKGLFETARARTHKHYVGINVPAHHGTAYTPYPLATNVVFSQVGTTSYTMDYDVWVAPLVSHNAISVDAQESCIPIIDTTPDYSQPFTGTHDYLMSYLFTELWVYQTVYHADGTIVKSSPVLLTPPHTDAATVANDITGRDDGAFRGTWDRAYHRTLTMSSADFIGGGFVEDVYEFRSYLNNYGGTDGAFLITQNQALYTSTWDVVRFHGQNSPSNLNGVNRTCGFCFDTDKAGWLYNTGATQSHKLYTPQCVANHNNLRIWLGTYTYNYSRTQHGAFRSYVQYDYNSYGSAVGNIQAGSDHESSDDGPIQAIFTIKPYIDLIQAGGTTLDTAGVYKATLKMNFSVTYPDCYDHTNSVSARYNKIPACYWQWQLGFVAPNNLITVVDDIAIPSMWKGGETYYGKLINKQILNQAQSFNIKSLLDGISNPHYGYATWSSNSNNRQYYPVSSYSHAMNITGITNVNSPSSANWDSATPFTITNQYTLQQDGSILTAVYPVLGALQGPEPELPTFDSTHHLHFCLAYLYAHDSYWGTTLGICEGEGTQWFTWAGDQPRVEEI